MPETLTKLVIRTSEWARGSLSALRVDDRFCCMGLWCRDLLGVKPDDMAGAQAPSEIHIHTLDRGHPVVVGVRDLTLQQALGWVNDDPAITDAERMEHITRLFALAGVDVEFIDDEPKEAPDAH